MRLSAELSLLAACCRWPPSQAREDAVRRFAAPPVDWDVFAKLAGRHRVGGLVHDGLKRAHVDIPHALAASFAAEAAGIARRNLAFAAECVRLRTMLEEKGGNFLFIKGVTLNMLAYGTLALKHASDIDLLVDSAGYGQAVELVEAAGYRCEVPGPDPSRDSILDWARHHKHTIWNRAGLRLELHSSLVENPPLVPALSVRSPSQTVEVAPGMALPTLARDELFAYLCAHGAIHGWSRLKWLADVAALLKDEDEAGILHLHRRSVELGGGRSAGQALLLSARLFDLRLPASLQRELEGELATRLLVRLALKSATMGRAGQELDEMMLGTAAIHFSYLLLDRGGRYKVAQVGRSLLGGLSDETPKSGRALQLLTSAPRWLLRRARVSRAAAAAARRGS